MLSVPIQEYCTTMQIVSHSPVALKATLTLKSPVPGKYSPYLWNDTVMTRSVV